jgi:multisubunit Na+/H+ antiporter MnhB subunit
VVLGATVIYIINVFGNDRVEKDKKALWAVVLFLGSILAMVVYWYLYIWRQTPAPAR